MANIPSDGENSFLKEVVSLNVSKDSKLIFICRSGARSRSAAEFLTNHGYKSCYNFVEDLKVRMIEDREVM